MNNELHLLFKQNWNIYQQVVAADYMKHRDIGEAVTQELSGTTDLQVLDAGCGDASVLLQILKGKTILQYTGYDLSAPALALAADNLATAGIPFQLREGAMETLLAADTNRYSVIHISYALHHLSDEAKAGFIQEAARHLLPGGKLILVDVFREEGQSRTEYIAAYLQQMEERWTVLSETEMELVREHIRNYDHPSTLSFMLAQMKEAGLHPVVVPAGDRFHQLICC